MAERAPGEDPTTPDGTPEEYTDQIVTRYGRVRGFLKRREDRLQPYRRRLHQAHIPVPVDVYLTRTIRLTGYGAGGGGVLGAALGTALWLRAGGSAMAIALLAAIAAVVVGGVVGGSHYLLPTIKARQRRLEIEQMLPYGIAYLYALTQGGVKSFDALRALAESQEDYGALATELQTAVNDVDHLGADPIGAMLTLQERTASDSLREFLEGMTGTIEAGGNVNQYLLTETDAAYQQVERDQDRFLEELSLYAELYIGLLVVAPIFGVIVLLVVTILGAGGSILPLAVLVYLVVPALTGAFLWIISQATTSEDRTTIQSHKRRPTPPDGVDPERYAAYQTVRSAPRWKQAITAPVEWLRQQPLRTLVVTVPLGAVIFGSGVLLGDVSTTAAAERPIITTTLFGIVPLAVIMTPIVVVHERQKRRDSRLTGQFPDVLEQIANANKQGLTVAEALAVAARSATGPIGQQLEMTARDLQWGASITEALADLRRRLPLRSLQRTLSLITDASKYSSSLYRVIGIAARDAKSSLELRRNRHSETRTYTIIVIISFALYLFMLVVLDQFFLAELEELPAVAADSELFGISFQAELDRGIYQLVLFHAAVIQGVGAGLVAGELGEESWLGGVKYSLLLTLAAAVAFFVFVS